MDEIDAAQAAEELARHLAIRAIASRKSEAPHGGGACLNCEESLTGGLRWCDFDCQADWTKRNRFRA